MDRMAMAEAERGDFADLLDGLTAEQWRAPSLCPSWSVRDVVAHVLSYEDLRPHQLARLFLRGRFRSSRINHLALQRFSACSPTDLISRMRDHLIPRGLTTGFHGGIALTDALIHQQDIRRPLGLDRAVPVERLVAALDMPVGSPDLPARRHVRGLRLIATDLDWSRGQGPELRGSGEALLMVLAGRGAALADCNESPAAHLVHTRLSAAHRA